MNNKDLFNAINDIDEKFIEDAGKYLIDDEADDPLHSGAVEVYPGVTRFSPLKLVASIAAAAVFITGISIAFNHYRGRINVDPNTGEAASLGGDNTPGIGDDNSAANIGTHAPQTNTPLPFEVIGPDNRQLWYDDITSAESFKTDADTQDYLLSKQDLTEDNWFSLYLGFAYVAAANGYNYNTIDNSPADVNGANDTQSYSFKRIQKGDTFMGLTVKEASSTISRLATPDEYDENDNVTRVTALTYNYVEFEGSMTADVYFINDGGKYYCIFRYGANSLPIMEYSVYDFLTTGEYTTLTRTYQSFNAIQYAGEMPTLELDEDEKALIEPYLANSDYVKATATFDNISIECTQALSYCDYTCSASLKEVTLSYVDTDKNLMGEIPFDEKTEMKLRAILGCASDITELRNNAEVMNLTDCEDIRVYRGIANMAGEFGEEIPEGTLTPGMIIELRGSDGEHVAAYRIREDVLPD